MTTEENNPTMAQKEAAALILTHAEGFEAGLNVVIAGALDNMHPMGIALGCTRSMIKTAATYAMSASMDDDAFEKLVYDLVHGVFEDMRSGYTELAAQEPEAAAA